MSEKRQSAAKKTAEKEVSTGCRSRSSIRREQPARQDARRRGELPPAQGGSNAAGPRRVLAVPTGKGETADVRAGPIATAEEAAIRHTKVNRRNFLTVVAGTAAVGEAAALGYSIVKDQNIPAHGARHAGDTYTEGQRHSIERELGNPGADIGGRGFGDWVFWYQDGAGPTQ